MRERVIEGQSNEKIQFKIIDYFRHFTILFGCFAFVKKSASARNRLFTFVSYRKIEIILKNGGDIV